MYYVNCLTPIDGVNSTTKQPFRFYEVCATSSQESPKSIGVRSYIFHLTREDLANELAFKLKNAIEDGENNLPVKELISHYSRGRSYLDYIVFE